MKTLLLLAAACTTALSACTHTSYLDNRTEPGRADYGDNTLPVPPTPAEPAPRINMINPSPIQNPPIVRDIITGTWTFTVPRTVTRVERQTNDYSQYSLYNGRPAPTDKPFVIITVSADPRSIAESDPATYHIANTREYTLNGNPVKEWSGNTTTGEAFSESVISKPGGGGGGGGAGDICHAMAVARTEEERQLSLQILSSIVWKSASGSAQSE